LVIWTKKTQIPMSFIITLKILLIKSPNIPLIKSTTLILINITPNIHYIRKGVEPESYKKNFSHEALSHTSLNSSSNLLKWESPSYEPVTISRCEPLALSPSSTLPIVWAGHHQVGANLMGQTYIREMTPPLTQNLKAIGFMGLLSYILLNFLMFIQCGT